MGRVDRAPSGATGRSYFGSLARTSSSIRRSIAPVDAHDTSLPAKLGDRPIPWTTVESVVDPGAPAESWDTTYRVMSYVSAFGAPMYRRGTEVEPSEGPRCGAAAERECKHSTERSDRFVPVKHKRWCPAAPPLSHLAISVSGLHLTRPFRHDADRVIDHLEKSAFDAESPGAAVGSEAERPFPQQRHHWGVPRKDAYFAVECGSDQRIDAPIEQRLLG